MNLVEVIKGPVITEKGTLVNELGNQVVFRVDRRANKVEIRNAIETLFKVSVTQVRTLVARGKDKRVGKFSGRRPAWKKAVVTLKAGDQIAFFEGV